MLLYYDDYKNLDQIQEQIYSPTTRREGIIYLTCQLDKADFENNNACRQLQTHVEHSALQLSNKTKAQ